MTWYADLSPCTYFSLPTPLTAVGWLDPAHPYPEGQVAASTLVKLFYLLEDPWSPTVFMGSHRCGLCPVSGGPDSVRYWPEDPSPFMGLRVDVGCTNLFVPGDEVVYVAPSMILHYLDAHRYQPPAAFLAAVDACPPMGSAAYHDALRTDDAGRWGWGVQPQKVVYESPSRDVPHTGSS